MTKPKIAVFYALARSGGTLLSRCLACMEGNVLLSEVHPSSPHFNPLVQAADWYNLIDVNQRNIDCSTIDQYRAAIELIHEKCNTLEKKLIIRDWPHIDFTPELYNKGLPNYQLLQKKTLSGIFELNEITMVRHPADYYLSLINLVEIRKLKKNETLNEGGQLSLENYLLGFKKFIQATVHTKRIRYEDLCSNPKEIISKICHQLEVRFDPTFITKFGHYSNVTGDVYHLDIDDRTLAGDIINKRSNNLEISLPARRVEYDEYNERFLACDTYHWIIQELGYEL